MQLLQLCGLLLPTSLRIFVQIWSSPTRLDVILRCLSKVRPCTVCLGKLYVECWTVQRLLQFFCNSWVTEHVEHVIVVCTSRVILQFFSAALKALKLLFFVRYCHQSLQVLNPFNHRLSSRISDCFSDFSIKRHCVLSLFLLVKYLFWCRVVDRPGCYLTFGRVFNEPAYCVVYKC